MISMLSKIEHRTVRNSLVKPTVVLMLTSLFAT